MHRKLSSSRSSTDVFTPNSCSSRRSSSTNASESRIPLSKRSVSGGGASRLSPSEKIWPIRFVSSRFSVMSDFLVFGREKVVPEPVVGPPVDEMALPLAADRPETDPCRDLDRRIVLDDPGLDRIESELREPERQHPRGGAARVAMTCMCLVAEDDPVGRRLEMRIHVAEAGDADRRIMSVGCEHPQHVSAALNGNLEPLRA